MRLTSPQDWMAWAGIVLPLAALAWSAVFYTIARRGEVQRREFERFFQVTDHLGQPGGSIASKMAAAYELRKYPQYAAVIINSCERSQIVGESAQMLSDELSATAEFFRRS